MKTIDDLIATLNDHHQFNTTAHTANILQNQENDRNLDAIHGTLQEIKLDLNNFFRVQQKQFEQQQVTDLENQREAGRAAGAGASATSAGAKDKEASEQGLFGGKFGFAALVTGLTAAVSGYIVGLSQAIASSFAATSKLVTAGFNGLSNIITTRFANIVVSFKSFFEPVARIARALSDILSKGGTGQFLKGDTYKVFGKFSSIMYNISDVIAKFVKSFGNLGARIGRIASAFSDILSKGGTSQFLKGNTYKVFGKFTETMYKISDGIAKFVKSTGNFASRFGTTFKPFVEGFKSIFGVMKKFAVPLTVIIAAVRAIYETVTEATGFFDGVFSLIKNLFKELVSAFVTFPLELIKDIISWIAGALGFEGIAAALDSFDIDAIFRNIVDGIYDGIKGVLSWIAGKLNPFNWFGGDTQDDIDSETKKLESDVQDAKADAADLANAYAVSDDGSYMGSVTLSSNTYEQNKEASEQELISKGYKLATPEQRQQMQQAADDRVAQAEAALKEHQDVSSVVSAVQPMNLFKHVGNLFGGGEEEQPVDPVTGKRGMSLGGGESPSVDPVTGKRGMVIPPSPIISDMSDGVGNLSSRVQGIFGRLGEGTRTRRSLEGPTEIGYQEDQTQTRTRARTRELQVKDLEDQAQGIFDPISDAFKEITSFVKDIFNVSKITDMIGSLFSGIGVPRVEFELPLIGSVGFGPFYPFGEGSTPVKEPAKDTVKIDDGAESSSGNLTVGEMRKLENQTEPGKRDFNNPLRSLLDDYKFTDNQQELQDKELAGYLQRSQEAKAAFEAFESGDRGSFKMVEDEFGLGENKVYDDAAEQEKFEQLRKEKAGAESKFRRASGIASGEYFEQIEFLKDRGVISSEPGQYSFSGQELQQMMMDYLENVQLDTPTAVAPEVSPEVSEQVTPEAVGFKYPVTDYDGNLIAVVDTPEEAAEVAMKNKGIIRNPVTASADLGPIVDTAVDNVVSSTQPSDETGSAEARPMTDEELIEFYENFIEKHKRKLERAKEKDDIGAVSTYRNQIDDMEFRLKHLKEKAAGTAEPPPDLTYDPSKDQYTDELFEESSDQPDNVSLINTPDTTEAAEAVVTSAAEEVTVEPKDTFLPSQSADRDRKKLNWKL